CLPTAWLTSSEFDSLMRKLAPSRAVILAAPIVLIRVAFANRRQRAKSFDAFNRVKEVCRIWAVLLSVCDIKIEGSIPPGVIFSVAVTKLLCCKASPGRFCMLAVKDVESHFVGDHVMPAAFRSIGSCD